MFLYFDSSEIPAVTNGRLLPNDVVLPSDKGLVIIDLDEWYRVMKYWNKFSNIANALNLGYNNWYLIAADQKEGEFQDECQSICDFESFKKFTDAIGVFDYVLVPTTWNVVDSFMDNKNTKSDFWVQVLDN